MKKRKTDSRTIRTKENITTSFVKLLCLFSINQISVSDVTSLSSINRNTFYLHYSSLNALLNHLENKLINDFNNITINKNIEELAFSPNILLDEYINYLSQNESYAKLLFLSSESDKILKKLQSSIIDILWNKYQVTIHSKDMRYHYGIRFIINGFFYTFQHWYSSQNETTLDNYQQRICMLIEKGAYRTFKDTLYR